MTPESVIHLYCRFDKHWRSPQALDDILLEFNDYNYARKSVATFSCQWGQQSWSVLVFYPLYAEAWWYLNKEIQKFGKALQNTSGSTYHTPMQIWRDYLVWCGKWIETEQSGSLNPTTVNSLLSVKMNTDASCFDCHKFFIEGLWKSAKSATMDSLNQSIKCSIINFLKTGLFF